MTDTNQLPEPELGYIKTDKSNQPAFSARQMREAMTERELELIDGMIAVQLDHAQRCDAISNRAMAEKQKGWDMERVELLRRIRSLGITAQATQVEMTDDVLRDAERYRYLRDIRRRDSIVLSGPEAGVWCDAEDEDGTLLLLTEDDLDAAIDDAMIAAK